MFLDLSLAPHTDHSHHIALGAWSFLTLHTLCFLPTISTISFPVIFLAAFLLSSGSPQEDNPQDLVLICPLEYLIPSQLSVREKATFRPKIGALPAQYSCYSAGLMVSDSHGPLSHLMTPYLCTALPGDLKYALLTFPTRYPSYRISSCKLFCFLSSKVIAFSPWNFYEFITMLFNIQVALTIS